MEPTPPEQIKPPITDPEGVASSLPTAPEATPDMVTVPQEYAVTPVEESIPAAPDMITVPEGIAPTVSEEPAPTQELPIISAAPGVEPPVLDGPVHRAGETVTLTDEQVAALPLTAVNRIAESAAFGAPSPEAAEAVKADVFEAHNAAVQAAAQNINSETALATEVEPPTNPNSTEAPQA